MAEKQMSATTEVICWLRERGPQFQCTPKEINQHLMHLKETNISSAMHRLYTENRVMRVMRPDRSYQYTVLDSINSPRPTSSKRVYNGRRAPDTITKGQQEKPPKTVNELIDDALTLMAALGQRAMAPLSSYTDLELSTELHRRMTHQAGLPK